MTMMTIDGRTVRLDGSDQELLLIAAASAQQEFNRAFVLTQYFGSCAESKRSAGTHTRLSGLQLLANEAKLWP